MLVRRLLGALFIRNCKGDPGAHNRIQSWPVVVSIAARRPSLRDDNGGHAQYGLGGGGVELKDDIRGKR